MRAFKNTWFNHFAAKGGISDDELRAIVNRLEAGQADADLGGGVFKARVARPGAGKSSGYRIIIFFRSGDKTFFHYGYAKSARRNITRKELLSFKEFAKKYMAMTSEQIETALKSGKFVEIQEDEKWTTKVKA